MLVEVVELALGLLHRLPSHFRIILRGNIKFSASRPLLELKLLAGGVGSNGLMVLYGGDSKRTLSIALVNVFVGTLRHISDKSQLVHISRRVNIVVFLNEVLLVARIPLVTLLSQRLVSCSLMVLVSTAHVGSAARHLQE